MEFNMSTERKQTYLHWFGTSSTSLKFERAYYILLYIIILVVQFVLLFNDIITSLIFGMSAVFLMPRVIKRHKTARHMMMVQEGIFLLFLVYQTLIWFLSIYYYFHQLSLQITLTLLCFGALQIYTFGIFTKGKRISIFTKRAKRKTYMKMNPDFTLTSEGFSQEYTILRLYELCVFDDFTVVGAYDIIEEELAKKGIQDYNSIRMIFEKKINKKIIRQHSLAQFRVEILKLIANQDSVLTSFVEEDIISRLMRAFNDTSEKVSLGEIIEILTNPDSSRDSLKRASKKEVNSNSIAVQLFKEINHDLQTPLALIRATSENIKSNSHLAEQKIDNILDSIQLIYIILESKKEFTFLTLFSNNERIIDIDRGIILWFNHCNSRFGTKLKLECDNIPKRISPYSNNLILGLLFPLIHNAIEAAPIDTTITLKYICNKDDRIRLIITNQCMTPINEDSFNVRGYSSKGDGHIGNGIDSVRNHLKIITDSSLNYKVEGEKITTSLTIGGIKHE